MKKASKVGEYLASVPQPAAATFSKLRATIRAAMPSDAVEVISYGVPAFKLDKIVLWYAAFEKHCSIFPTAEVIRRFKSELQPYKISKGTVQFPLDKPLPVALVRKMVKERLASMRTKG